jgi:hypothetical protein
MLLAILSTSKKSERGVLMSGPYGFVTIHRGFVSIRSLSVEKASYRTIFGSKPRDSWYSVSSEARIAAAMIHCLTDGCVAVCGIGFVI